MPEEVRRRVGEPFFSSGKKQGTGLGMAMVKKILDDHRGAVEIESAPGAGTTVRLLLPLGTG
jgi:signal transduction histidine kinase